MKKYLSKLPATLIVIVGIVICMAMNVLAADAPDPNKDKSVDNKTAAVGKTGYLENVLFTKLSGKERITLVVSQQPVVNIGSQSDNSLLIKLENMIVTENLRRVLGENELSNIIRLTPQQQEIEGKQWIYLTVDLKNMIPYAIKQEGQNIYIDFNITSLAEKKPVVATKPTPASGKKQKTAEKKVTAKADAEIVKAAEAGEEKEEKQIKPKKEAIKRYTERMISIDFQEADIKSVLRLMAEYGNVSIVSGDDVKGNVTLTMKNVPWDQALEAILDVNGLSKKQTGDVISVLTHERKKKDEADRVSAEDAQRKAEDQRKARETQVLAEKGKLRQVLIEAKIVEATEEFIRNIGVQWGFMNTQSIGTYGLGVSGGSNSISTGGARSQVYPSNIPWTDPSTSTALTMAAVNFPAAVASPTIGLVFGSAAGFLETQLAALESTTSGKIISAPKVVTMDGVKATIKQGDEVPYVTPASGTSPATITFKEAVLRLEVKPKITPEGKISMEILASNDIPDYAIGATLQGNPPIRKEQVESTVVVQDGDTVVIGGILRNQEDKSVSGLPWLQNIPILGWLFKTEGLDRQKRQLLIFVTPKILKSEGFSESAEKIIN
jgi:type IV pilus assembly protein PilQ